MIFTSLKFIVFLIAVVAVYYIVPAAYRWIVLLAGSIVFYCISGMRFLPFILVTAGISYLAARVISGKYQKVRQQMEPLQKAGESTAELYDACRRSCRRIVTVVLVLIIGILCYTKFARMLLNALAGLFAQGADFSSLQIIVPLGISYYTFSTVGYVLDVYWERYEAEKNFGKYLLYVMYFPHILQGPIARYDRLGVQFSQPHYFDDKRVCFGIQLIMWGFIQKLVIADRVGVFVSAVYDTWMDQNGSVLLVATLFYAVQIYMDFSGCVDIARGVSQIFGIELEENFRQPYFAQSVAEFWRRWHMTLGAWFKDYLCMPVAVSGGVKELSKKMRKRFGKKAGKNTVTICSLVAVWICTGLWHGTGWNYIIWGIWQGGIIIISTLLEPEFVKAKKKFGINEESVTWQRYRILRTFVLTGIIPRIITRAPGIPAAFGIFKRIFTSFGIWQLFDGSLYQFGLDRQDFWFSLLAIYILYLISKKREQGIRIREAIASKPVVIRWAIYYAAILVILIFGIYGPGYDASSFVYMNF